MRNCLQTMVFTAVYMRCSLKRNLPPLMPDLPASRLSNNLVICHMKRRENNQSKQIAREDPVVYESREALEDARLREAIGRTDLEKFRLFTKMMRISMMLK